jgi:DNA-binding NtrC family response regulator
LTVVPNTNPAKVVVLEDDNACMGFFRSALVRGGYQPLAASTCCEVQRHLENHAVKVLLLDLLLSTQWCHGTDIALRAQKTHPDVGILFVSGTPFGDWNEADRQNAAALQEGSFKFLGKPFTVQALLARLDDLVKRRRFENTAPGGCPHNEECPKLNQAGTGAPLLP